MSDDVLDLLKTLCAIPGPVGREEMVQEFIQDKLRQYCSDIKQDKIGNLTATLEGTGKHYAIVAHADEVGFFVSNIDKNGFIRAKWNTQGYEPDFRLLPGQWVLIMSDSGLVPGCFCVKTAHIAGPEGKKKLPKWDDIFIDIGLSSPEEVESLGIHVGSPVIYAASVEKVGHNIMGKSFDNRVGLVIMIQLAKRLAKIPVEKRPRMTFVSTVMEEIGAKGAAAIAKNLDVDGVIILDIGLADDYPGTKGEAGVKLGKGPVVVIKDNQLVYSHKQNQRILGIAEAQGISVQRAVYHNYATDGFQIASHGQVVSVIGVPCRYSHSSFEAINLTDVESTLQLVYHFLSSM
ncbi:MAG: M42 family metallopeptidase [Candidatus Thorarchaeota archaeon]|jgi:endoglucanase